MNNMTQIFLFFERQISKTMKYILLTETYIQLGFKQSNNSYSESPYLVE